MAGGREDKQSSSMAASILSSDNLGDNLGNKLNAHQLISGSQGEEIIL